MYADLDVQRISRDYRRGCGASIHARKDIERQRINPRVDSMEAATPTLSSEDDSTPRPAAHSPILLVEDNEDTREVVAMVLAAEGFTVVTAENGQRGLERLLRTRPCLVLLDLMMPVMTGWEFRRLQLSLPDSELASVPVLLLTAVNDPKRVAAELNAADVIPKPLDFDQLIESVRRHCRDPLP